MERIRLEELQFDSRAQALTFLKRLWRGEAADCPLCGAKLEPLHRGAKKSSCDWQCRPCGKTYKTIHLLDELNEQRPGPQRG